MRLALSKLPLTVKEMVGQAAVSGTASIRARHSRPTNEPRWWDSAGQVAATCFGDFSAYHPIHRKSSDVGRHEPACPLTVPRLPVVPPCDYLQRDAGLTIDLLSGASIYSLTMAGAQQPPTVSTPLQPRTRGGCVAPGVDVTPIAVSGARHAAD
jgi:hypothetical protein